MTYTVAAAIGVLAAVAIDLFLTRSRLIARPVFWVAYAIVLGFQVIFNGVLAGRGIVRYSEAAITGLRVFRAPIEDFAFGFALVLATLTVWVWWETRAGAGTPRSGSGQR